MRHPPVGGKGICTRDSNHICFREFSRGARWNIFAKRIGRIKYVLRLSAARGFAPAHPATFAPANFRAARGGIFPKRLGASSVSSRLSAARGFAPAHPVTFAPANFRAARGGIYSQSELGASSVPSACRRQGDLHPRIRPHLLPRIFARRAVEYIRNANWAHQVCPPPVGGKGICTRASHRICSEAAPTPAAPALLSAVRAENRKRHHHTFPRGRERTYGFFERSAHS